MHTVCVFSGSSPGARPEYADAARCLGEEVARRGQRLVYGGASVGLMRVVADAVLDAGGDVVGVMPQHLIDKEIAYPRLTDLRITGSMHERKALMADLSDGFVALPGGYGTLEEFTEVLTWSQLGLQQKPCGLLDVAGFYTALRGFLDHAVSEQFIRPEHRRLVIADTVPADLLDALSAWEPTGDDKWLDRTDRSVR
ncbi:MAG: TIGR00730 family Rossman fold protein [Nocardioidaceae bacterium]